jgi:hypothetical protein
MTEQTATIDGVQLTEVQLREGLAQIEAQRNRAITVGDCYTRRYINIPPAVAADIVKEFHLRPDCCYVTLHLNGDVGFNFPSSGVDSPILKGFTS